MTKRALLWKGNLKLSDFLLIQKSPVFKTWDLESWTSDCRVYIIGHFVCLLASGPILQVLRIFSFSFFHLMSVFSICHPKQGFFFHQLFFSTVFFMYCSNGLEFCKWAVFSLLGRCDSLKKTVKQSQHDPGEHRRWGQLILSWLLIITIF